MSTQAAAERTDPRRQRSSAALLDAAGRLFAEQGFAATTVEQIAAEAGLAVRTIYGNFGGKRGLYLAAVQRAAELNGEYQRAVFESDLSPAEKMAASGAAYVRLFFDHPGQFRLIQVSVLESGDSPLPEVAAAIREHVDGITELMAETIEAAIADGTMRPVPALPAARFLWASLTGSVALSMRPGMLRVKVEDVAEVVRVGFGITAEGLAGAALRASDGLMLPELRKQIEDLMTESTRQEERP